MLCQARMRRPDFSSFELFYIPRSARPQTSEGLVGNVGELLKKSKSPGVFRSTRNVEFSGSPGTRRDFE
jgi:hypothetical protein